MRMAIFRTNLLILVSLATKIGHDSVKKENIRLL